MTTAVCGAGKGCVENWHFIGGTKVDDKEISAGQMSLEVLHTLTDVAKVQILIQEGMNVFWRTYLILIQNLKVYVTLLPSC